MLPRLRGGGVEGEGYWGEERLLAFGIIVATDTHGASHMGETVGGRGQFIILPQGAHITHHHSSRQHDTEGEEGAVGGK